jgi:hypothetical protein
VAPSARRAARIPALVAALLAASAPARAAPRAEFRVLPSYLSGDFGTGIQSDIAYLPFIVTLRGTRDDWRFTLPWLAIRTDEPITFVGGDVIQRGAGGSTEESGPGDLVAEYDRYLLAGGVAADGRRRPWVTAGLRLKLPTADEDRGLGTGEPDWGPQAAIVQPVGALWHVLAEARYVVRGDPPGFDYRNTWWLAAGVQRRLGDGIHLSVVLDNRQSVLRGRDTIRDLTIAYDRRLSPVAGLRSALYAGLSDTAEDFGLMIGLAFSPAAP